MSQGWSIRNIYMYLISFVTLMMVLFGIISFLNNTARFFLETDYRYYITLMDIEQEYLNTGRDVPPVKELERIREERHLAGQEEDYLRNRAYRLRNLIGSLAVWLVPLPFYLYHWRKIKEEHYPPRGGATA